MFRTIGDFIGFLEHEHQGTRKAIAALPDAGHGYRPDPKSKSAGELAWHLPEARVFFLGGLLKLPVGDPLSSRWPKPPSTTAEMVEALDRTRAAASQALEGKGDAWLAEPVDFFGQKRPRGAILAILLHHEIHHRGQLTSYLRSAGGKVPGIYGPSADEA